MRLRLRRPGSHVAYACAGAFVARVNQPLRAIQIFLYLTLVLIAGVFILARESLFWSAENLSRRGQRIWERVAEKWRDGEENGVLLLCPSPAAGRTPVFNRFPSTPYQSIQVHVNKVLAKHTSLGQSCDWYRFVANSHALWSTIIDFEHVQSFYESRLEFFGQQYQEIQSQAHKRKLSCELTALLWLPRSPPGYGKQYENEIFFRCTIWFLIFQLIDSYEAVPFLWDVFPNALNNHGGIALETGTFNGPIHRWKQKSFSDLNHGPVRVSFWNLKFSQNDPVRTKKSISKHFGKVLGSLGGFRALTKIRHLQNHGL